MTPSNPEQSKLHSSEAAQSLYELITEDTDNACEAIPDSACRQAPGNFILNALNGASTKLAEQIASPSLVLPWVLAALGAPASLSGFLVPASRGGSLLPQLVVSARIRAFKVRKWFWVGAGTVQALSLLLMTAAALTLSGTLAGISIILCLLLFSVASGVGSVSFKDVLAKTIPKGKRGTLLSVRATLGGALALAAGYLLYHFVGEGESVSVYVILLVAAALLWLLASFLFAAIREYPGATEGGRDAIEEARRGWRLLKENQSFARFVAARSFLLSVMLVIPFYAIFAREITGTQISGLGLFVIANSLAMLLSSYFWGRFADSSSRLVMASGGIAGIIACAMALSFPLLDESFHTSAAFSAIFFVAGFAHAGIRLGRKTWLVDAAPEIERPLYVSVSNTVVGIITVASAALGFIADAASVGWLIGVFAAFMLIGVVLALRLPEAEEMAASN